MPQTLAAWQVRRARLSLRWVNSHRTAGNLSHPSFWIMIICQPEVRLFWNSYPYYIYIIIPVTWQRGYSNLSRCLNWRMTDLNHSLGMFSFFSTSPEIFCETVGPPLTAVAFMYSVQSWDCLHDNIMIPWYQWYHHNSLLDSLLEKKGFQVVCTASCRTCPIHICQNVLDWK